MQDDSKLKKGAEATNSSQATDGASERGEEGIAGDGGAPCRAGHSCTALPDGRLFIFGGIDDQVL